MERIERTGVCGADSACGGNDVDENPPKRRKLSRENNDNNPPTDKDCRETFYHPSSFVTWNCNGFTSRAIYNRDKLFQLVRDTNNPDVICLQEARLRAAGPGDQKGRPGSEGPTGPAREQIRAALSGPFEGYTPFWSLADTKYAGTLTLIREACLRASGSSPSQNTEGCYDPDLVAFTPGSAIDLMLRRFGKTREDCGLETATEKNASASPSSSPQKKTQQTSLTSFFAPKPKTTKANTNTTPGTLAVGGIRRGHRHEHHPEGRFQFVFFPGMDFVQTYVPNNGTKEESFRRRREWDREMRRFVTERKRILEVCSNDNGRRKNPGDSIDTSRNRKFLWCGDMNVAAGYKDGSHWKITETGGGAYEWFRDEAKCLGKFKTSSKHQHHTKRPENVGIPGFTPAERERFAAFLEEGSFCDVWRTLHPNGAAAGGGGDDQQIASSSSSSTTTAAATTTSKASSNPWELPNYTWRGALAKNFDGYARYQGKGQRIDYFLLSSPAAAQNAIETEIERCSILGHGTYREGLFCGSDHCAVELRFHPTRGGSSS